MKTSKLLEYKAPKSRIKSVILLVSLLIQSSFSVEGAATFLFTGTDPSINTFTPSEITTLVDETLNGDTKNNVRIGNTGSTEAYIRAAVVFSWQNSDGDICGTAVNESDCEITWSGLNLGSWERGSDGFFYYKLPIPAGERTDVLFTECRLKEGVTPPLGYYLSVEIIASGIQSMPATAVTESWSGVIGVNDDRSLAVKTN